VSVNILKFLALNNIDLLINTIIIKGNKAYIESRTSNKSKDKNKTT
jgi:hypothetical protein